MKNPSTPHRRRTYDLQVTNPVAQPLSYRSLMGAKATKLGSNKYWQKSDHRQETLSFSFKNQLFNVFLQKFDTVNIEQEFSRNTKS